MSQPFENTCLDTLLRDIALTVVHLRTDATIAQGETLYERCVEHISMFRQRLAEHHFVEADIDDMSYAACALLDETVLSRNDPESALIWQKTPLQVAFFNSYEAGDALFERIRHHLRQPEPSQPVLTCYDRILGLGFQGRYRGQPQTDRERLISAIRDVLPPRSTEDAVMIVNTAAETSSLLQRATLPFWTCISLVLLLMLFWGLHHHLENHVMQLLHEFQHD